MKSFSRLLRFAIAATLVLAAESPVWADDSASVTIDNIPTGGLGGTIPIQCSVTSSSPVAATFNVATEIKQNGNTLTQVNGGTALSVSAASGMPGSVTFNFTVPSGWTTGTYAAHAVVRDVTNTIWLGEYYQNFTVQANPAFTGRIAYEVYSTYLAPTSGMDGTIQVCSLPNGSPVNPIGSRVQQAVNPKFSPDGSKIVFAGVPLGGTPGSHNSLAIFLYDFADQSLVQLTSNHGGTSPGEDPNFSKDGQQIVYKYTPSSSLPGQLWIMNLDGTGQAPLTSTGDEYSAPCFSPTGNSLAYYTGGGTDSGGVAAETVWTVDYPITSTAIPRTVADGGLECYYPNYRDANTILYTRWVSSDDREGKIFAYSISSQSSLPLPTNMAGPKPWGYEDADAFPVPMPNTTLIGFSSTRPLNNVEPQENSEGPSVLYLGDTSSGAVYYLPNLDPNINSSTPLSALGGTYTPYSYARKLVMTTPASGSTLVAGTTVVFEVEAWSNGENWTGAIPVVKFLGVDSTSNTTLTDEGIRGNSGGELYSGSVTLPQTTAAYTVSVADSFKDNGVPNTITSSSLTVQPSTIVPTAPRWMIALLGPIFALAAFHRLQKRKA